MSNLTSFEIKIDLDLPERAVIRKVLHLNTYRLYLHKFQVRLLVHFH